MSKNTRTNQISNKFDIKASNVQELNRTATSVSHSVKPQIMASILSNIPSQGKGLNQTFSNFSQTILLVQKKFQGATPVKTT